MVLREKLKSTRMVTYENVASYLTRISQVRDELVAVGEKVDGSELVSTNCEWREKAMDCFRGCYSCHRELVFLR